MRNTHKPHGRHPHHRLTPVRVRALRAPGRYADGQGLYLVVDPSGAKRWIWRGVIQGKRSDLGLGSVHLVSLADARDAAVACRRVARNGGNPRRERQLDRRVVPTFRQAAETYYTTLRPTFRSTRHAAQWLTSLENHVFPLIGDHSVATLDSADILNVLTPIWTVKLETARRLKQRMQAVFEWAKVSGFRSGDNPTDGLKKVLPKKDKGDPTHHAALPYQAVPPFLAALRALPDLPAPVRLGLELLILTATRTSELRLATWAEIDLAQQVWTIPAARMKNGREHRIPLSARAVELLDQARGLTDGTSWIFPSSKPGRPLLDQVFRRAGRRIATAPLTTHGFRSSFRDWCEERTNTPRTVAEAALAHVVKDKTEAAYRRTDLFDRRRELMDKWAQFATSTPATVVAIGA